MFQLHLITDKGAAPDLVGAVGAALEGGVDWVQVREKSAPAQDLYETALRIGRLCRTRGAGLIINDRVDVAMATGAAGVHLAARSLPVSAVRPILSPGRLIGASVHSLAEAVAAEAAGADYVTFGSVFPSRTHNWAAGQGLAALAEVVRTVRIPVVAIGGITEENLPEVLQTGCSGVAIISAVLLNADPAGAAARLKAIMNRSDKEPLRRM
ncbi:MAG TPA: thiamine phosphate synthase [Symbiobacteriaceae bacterium]|nr:thiamine phosphate synthase [Symbiobacteriaceae bacterium]